MSKRCVFLDPDGSGTERGWAFVVVAAPTGVVHRTQGGGFGRVSQEQEGCLIPLFGRELDADLRAFFVGGLKGQGAHGLDWPPELLVRLRDAVAEFRVYGATNHDDTWPAALALDESRLDEADEAWLPVLTPDGPGWLAWENSD
ncbi:hypothetical protein DI272_41805 [Streptomyces sp. Act143]|uniref:DUF6210 family protein n=1 Tax=Streptomyces sp. Act143 TaxID=2200760 RepID=UPI000D679417|nr:DUF6210 family protein [Streptomyces sp. Act143]PWI19980.1 hypothetical protein DI272_41805 [Streptomyces sp. Act143]